MASGHIPGDMLRDDLAELDEVLASESGTLPPSVGERNPAARMTADGVRALRAAYRAGGTLRHLARAFGISERAARHIVRGTSWTHVR